MDETNNATADHGSVTVDPGCPIAKFGQMDSLNMAYRSALLENPAEVYSGAHNEVILSEFTKV